ncbi:hypothetical protein PUN28_013229 [Cardiocondyla obscurior]|uniref:Uncharacterized protein n=1 Tax=Cardiocondyla obscurior TaxID=286306 RepID=A0AAW2F7L7_9HYME
MGIPSFETSYRPLNITKRIRGHPCEFALWTRISGRGAEILSIFKNYALVNNSVLCNMLRYVILCKKHDATSGLKGVRENKLIVLPPAFLRGIVAMRKCDRVTETSAATEIENAENVAVCFACPMRFFGRDV